MGRAALTELRSLQNIPAHVSSVLEVVYIFLNPGSASSRVDTVAARKLLANDKVMLQQMRALVANLEHEPLPADVVEAARGRIQQNEAAFASQRRPVHAALALHRWTAAVVGLQEALLAERGADDSATATSPDAASDTSMRAVSVYHLATAFSCRIKAVGMDLSSVVYEVEPVVIRPEGERRKCPRDGKVGAAYVDCFQDADDVGAATRMLSYTWGYRVSDIIETLEAHCRRTQSDPKRTYVWMCCLCINQHRVREMLAAGENVPFEAFRQTFRRRVEEIGHVVAMMSPWRAPVYISRVWCDFELYTATQQGVHVTIEMPPEEALDFLASLEKGTGIDEMWKVLNDLSIQKANASVKEDRDRILQLIRDGPGYHAFDSAVATLLQSWIADVAERHITVMLSDGSVPYRALTTSCLNVSELLYKGGRVDRASEIVEQGLERLRSSQDQGPDMSAYEANMLSRLCHCKRQLGDLDGAEQAYVLQRKLSGHAVDVADMTGASLLLLERGDTEGALRGFDEALDLAKSTGVDQGRLAAIYVNIGNAKAKTNDILGAIAAYVQARAAYEAADMLSTPDAALVVMNLANVQRMAGAMSDALQSYVEAQRIFERTGTLQSPKGASLLVNLAIAHGQSGHFQEALDCSAQAKAFLEVLGMLATPLDQQATAIIAMARDQLKSSTPAVAVG